MCRNLRGVIDEKLRAQKLLFMMESFRGLLTNEPSFSPYQGTTKIGVTMFGGIPFIIINIIIITIIIFIIIISIIISVLLFNLIVNS